MHFCSCYKRHTTLKVYWLTIDKYNSKGLVKKIAIQLKNQIGDTSRETSIRKVVLLYSQIKHQNIALISNILKIEKNNKELNIEKIEKYDIREVVIKVIRHVCNVRNSEIINKREDIKIVQKYCI